MILKKSLSILLAFLILIPSVNVNVIAEEDSSEVTNESDDNSTESNEQEESVNDDSLVRELHILIDDDTTNEVDNQQDNSISMLNYLTVLSQEINSSKNSRLFLEEAYSSIINDTYPNAVDERTKIHLENLLDIIQDFRMIDVKRERLNYLYQQNQAQALRSAIPNPLGLLSAVQSFDLKRIIASGLYMAIDSVTSYNAYKSQLEMQYLQDGWALDDEESKTVSNNRKDAFIYMIDIVNSNNLPGEYALNEESVADLVKWKNNNNVTSRIQFLEDNENTYKEYGGYWLLLASSYYEKENYDKCLEAVKTYEEKQGRIFRIDHEFAKVIPYAIVSLQKTLTRDSERIPQIEHYVNLLIANTKNDDWALRYFAAQTYVELGAETKNPKQKNEYLEKAYRVCLSNVNYLVEEQKNKNNSYLADIVEKKEPANATKEVKKEIKDYNKLLKEERKTALPPVSEALLLNCDLLFALSDEIKISSQEKQKINEILHLDDSPLFMNDVLNSKYWFDHSNIVSEPEINFDKRIISIPARLITNDFKVVVEIDDGKTKSVFSEWKVNKVTREEKDKYESFIVELECNEIKQYKFKENCVVTISVYPTERVECDPVVAEYKTYIKKILWVIDSIELEKVE